MQDRTYYAGIDRFRILAAVLVVAIHTSPLASIWGTGDFILTRIVARVAVPFFFMTSGFFLFRGQAGCADRLLKFIKKNLLLYGIAIVLYLPIMVYNGYFGKEQWWWNLLQDLWMDGTFYHLWYFPAAIVGALLAWVLIKYIGKHGALGISAVLYVIGLLGDSYYGLTAGVPWLQDGYDLLFQVMDYTRNGIFFAPLYFVLGALAANASVLSRKRCAMGFCISFLGLLLEGLLLHFCQVQRHDSMYILLVPCMFFLFSLLLGVQGKVSALLRPVSMLIYLVHPMMIIVVRGAAKVLGLQSLLIANSLVYFVAVLLCSVSFSVVAVVVHGRLMDCRERRILARKTARAWTEINLRHLKHNVLALQQMMAPGCTFMAVVKAEAYGHGMVPVSKYLNAMGIQSFVVATLDEGIQLRKNGIKGEILLLGYTEPACMPFVRKYRLIQSVVSFAYATEINACKIPVQVHLKIDTGMHRMGLPWDDTAAVVTCFSSLPYLQVCGMYTHFCSADSLLEEDVQFTRLQNQRFESLLLALAEQGIALPKVHCQSSYGLLHYPEMQWDYARMGIAMYGAVGAGEVKPVLSLKARVAAVKNVPQGEGVGYDRAFCPTRDSRLGVVTIGYADGIPRNLEPGLAYVLICGQRAPIVGRICMDQMLVDVTEISGVVPGDVVTLIGRDEEEEITAVEFAQWSGSIPNEILSRMGSRLERVEVQ